MPTVYVESSVISYLRQKPTADTLTAARQLLTTRWWTTGRSGYGSIRDFCGEAVARRLCVSVAISEPWHRILRKPGARATGIRAALREGAAERGEVEGAFPALALGAS